MWSLEGNVMKEIGNELKGNELGGFDVNTSYV